MSDTSGKTNTTNVHAVIANPSALGLFGLAIVTLVASSHKLGITDGTSLIIPWAIFLGACAQLFAGFSDSKLNNAFGTTAFCAYGFFWLGVATTWLIQNGVFGETMLANADVRQLGFAFVGYFIFTFYMTLGAANINKVLFIIFILIDFLFIGLACSVFGIAKDAMGMLAAVSELLISLVSFYGSAAIILNGQYGKQILPLGKPVKLF